MNRSTYLTISSIVVLSLGGCATIFSSGSNDVTFESEPAGATVFTVPNGNKLGDTPLTTPISKGMSSVSVEVKKDGYETKLVKLERTFNYTTLFNIIAFAPSVTSTTAGTTTGAAAFGIDALTGKMFEYSPNKYVVELEKKKKTKGAIDGPSALEMVVMNHQEFRKNLARNEQGELQSSLCHAWELDSNACTKLWISAYEKRTELLNASDSLAFYRALRPSH
jgi:hypothetical protein